jgi:excisionase family DNA binding protein
MSAGPLLTVREVAERLRVCTATVYRLCESGRLWHLRVSNAVRVPLSLLMLARRRNVGPGVQQCFLMKEASTF